MQDGSVVQPFNQRMRRILSRVAILSLLTLVYFLAGRLGLSLAIINPSASLIWPPTGIAIAAFLVLGDYAAFSILLGAFLVNFTTSDSLPSSITIAIGNTLEGLIAARLVNRYAKGTQALHRAREIFLFALLAGLLSPVVSATIGTFSLVWDGLASMNEYLPIWVTWWLGDAAGCLIVAPALILWAVNLKIDWAGNRIMEFIALIVVLLLGSFVVFGGLSSLPIRGFPAGFILLPILLWAAYRFEQRETATVILIFSIAATLGTLQGHGPFFRSSMHSSFILLQSYTMIATVTGLGLAALIAERKEVEAELKATNKKLLISLAELEGQSRKMLLLNEMGDLLQSCSIFEEVYSITHQLGQQLLPEEIGVLYIINNSKTSVEAAVTWGILNSELDAFTLDDCWALRRGRVHVYNANGSILSLLCPHSKHGDPAATLCIPLTAQGEAIGVLHLRSRSMTSSDGNIDSTHVISESKQQIARAMADSIGLALANLKLRSFLREQSIRDPLTNLFNRRYLEETLEREFNRAVRIQRPVGVVMIDLDHFKTYNDTYGHEAGDAMLRKLGAFMKQHLRGADIACRYGGEEFALVLPEVSLENVRARAEQIRQGAKDLRVQFHGEQLTSLTLSAGIAIFPDHGSTSQKVLNAADAALYEAKSKGRDRVVVAPIDEPEIPPAT